MRCAVNGLLVIDKPSGITSRAAVNRLQEHFPKRTKIGHAGTLDPLATGVLVVCLGSATRLAEYVQEMDKTYRTRLVLGARSDTDDADGTITPSVGSLSVEQDAIQSVLACFLGEVEQTPPAYSAIKVAGKRAHALARRGEPVDIAPRKVMIYSIETLDFRWPELVLEIRCGKGTYIRSLARDLGERLGCGAYVKELRRTRIGPFTTEEGVALDDAAAIIEQKLLPPKAAVAHLPEIRADAAAIAHLGRGQAVKLPGTAQPLGNHVAIVDVGGDLVGVGCVDDNGLIRPVKNLPGT